MTNKDLLHNTGDYLVITYNRKESETISIYIYIVSQTLYTVYKYTQYVYIYI